MRDERKRPIRDERKRPIVKRGTKDRRALTMAATPAKIHVEGDRTIGAALAKALDVANVSEGETRGLTHGFHTYPAKMHPITARRALELIAPPAGSTIVDPFCGSGTVLVEAMARGCRAIGVDASPLAILIARAKTWIAPVQRKRTLFERARRIADETIAEGKAARRSGYERRPEQRRDSKQEGRLAEWFDPHVRRELEFISSRVQAERDPELRDLLTAILSSVVVKVSRRASDTRREKVVRKIGRGMPARLFVDRTGELLDGIEALERLMPQGTAPAQVYAGDARRPPREVPFGEAAAVVTSPPYAGTYDYLEQHALRLSFLGLDATTFAKTEIGARRRFAGDLDRVDAALAEWDRDLAASIGQMRRVLAPGGRAAILIGDSLAGRPPAVRAVFADEVIARIARIEGLSFVAMASIERPPLGAAERVAFGKPPAPPKREHLILLERVAD